MQRLRIQSPIAFSDGRNRPVCRLRLDGARADRKYPAHLRQLSCFLLRHLNRPDPPLQSLDQGRLAIAQFITGQGGCQASNYVTAACKIARQGVQLRRIDFPPLEIMGAFYDEPDFASSWSAIARPELESSASRSRNRRLTIWLSNLDNLLDPASGV